MWLKPPMSRSTVHNVLRLIPLRPQTRHMAANTVDSISIFLTPASYAFLRYSSFSAWEKEHSAPSSRPWPGETTQEAVNTTCVCPAGSVSCAVKGIPNMSIAYCLYLRRSRWCTWCSRSPMGCFAARRSTAAARWPPPRPARCSWWWLYPEPPAQTGPGRSSPPLCLWSPRSLEPDLETTGWRN